MAVWNCPRQPVADATTLRLISGTADRAPGLRLGSGPGSRSSVSDQEAHSQQQPSQPEALTRVHTEIGHCVTARPLLLPSTSDIAFDSSALQPVLWLPLDHILTGDMIQ